MEGNEAEMNLAIPWQRHCRRKMPDFIIFLADRRRKGDFEVSFNRL
jgi:hypothetical protein